MERLPLAQFLKESDLFNALPLFTLAMYYGVALTIIEFARRLLDKCVRPDRLVHTFIVEFMSVTLLCACAFENGIVMKHYGHVGFAFIVYTLMAFNTMFNPGNFSNPLRPLELMLREKIPISKGATILTAQLCGAFAGPSIAMGIWYYSQRLFKEHSSFYHNLPCTFNYNVPLIYAFAYEVIAAFIIRTAITRLPQDGFSSVFPAVVTTMLTIALVVVGVPGINPIIITTRMFGCDGLSDPTFLALYWLSPMFGWWLGTFTEPHRGPAYTAPSAKKQQKKKKKN